MQFVKNKINYRLVFNIFMKVSHNANCAFGYSSIAVDATDLFEDAGINKKNNQNIPWNNHCTRYFFNSVITKSDEFYDVAKMNTEELENTIQSSMNNKNRLVIQILKDCSINEIQLSEIILQKLLINYSSSGKTKLVVAVQEYSKKTVPNIFNRNGEYLHYLAKAYFCKGNTEKCLSILKLGYSKYKLLRGAYRITLKQLIYDSILNRSEATIVNFKNSVLELSDEWDEHHPLMCLWHVCWISTWYSDQMIADELIDKSSNLREIVFKNSPDFCSMALRCQYNDDAVMRLLQTLLQYKRIEDYNRVLQILFIYKLKSRDLRACTEIVKNSEILGIELPMHIRDKYIKLVINDCSRHKNKTEIPTSKQFKLKF